MSYLFNDLRNYWSKEIGLESDGSVFLPFLNIGFSFATLQGLGKTPWEIDRLQRTETGFARMSAPSLKNLPDGGLKMAIMCLAVNLA